MNIENANLCVAEFFQGIGVPDFGLDEDGYCCIQLDEVVLNLELDPDTERLFLYSIVGEVPEKKREAFYEMILDADLFHKHTGGATLGLNRENHTIVMVYSIPVNRMEVPFLIHVVENFVEQAEKWQGIITDFPEESSETPPPVELGHNRILA